MEKPLQHFRLSLTLSRFCTEGVKKALGFFAFKLGVPFFCGYLKRVEGAENLLASRPYILACNHESNLDPGIIKCFMYRRNKRMVYYFIKYEYTKNLFGRLFFESVGTIPVDRKKPDGSVLERAAMVLKAGKIVGIFPEGTRTRDGKMMKGKTGCVRLALQTHCPIIPCGIEGTFELWPAHKKMPKYKKEVTLRIGRPVTFEKYYSANITKELLEKLTEKVMYEISLLVD